MQPKSPGEVEQFVVHVQQDNKNTTYYMSVRAVDENNNTGENSNILSLSIMTDSSWVTDDTERIPPSVKPSETSGFNVIIGILFGVVAPGVVILGFLAILRWRKIDNYSVKDAVYYVNKV